MALIRSLVARVVQKLALVPGTSVQTYGEDRIVDAIRSTFNLTFDKVWWEDYCGYRTYTLAGANGLVSDTITDVKRFTDIYAVWQGTSQYRLRRIPVGFNPLGMQGSSARYISPYNVTANKLFQVYPLTATGTLSAYVRVRPDDDEFTQDSTLLLDDEMLILGAVWEMLQADGANPGETDRYGGLFNSRFETIRAQRSVMPEDLDYRVSQTPTQWTESDGSFYG